jgi:hypothetical protein
MILSNSSSASALTTTTECGDFLHPQLPKIIIARLEEWKSCIVPVFWHADDLVADMATLNINDNTSDLAKRRRFPARKT